MNTIKVALLSISLFERLWAILRTHLKSWRIKYDTETELEG